MTDEPSSSRLTEMSNSFDSLDEEIKFYFSQRPTFAQSTVKKPDILEHTPQFEQCSKKSSASESYFLRSGLSFLNNMNDSLEEEVGLKNTQADSHQPKNLLIRDDSLPGLDGSLSSLLPLDARAKENISQNVLSDINDHDITRYKARKILCSQGTESAKSSSVFEKKEFNDEWESFPTSQIFEQFPSENKLSIQKGFSILQTQSKIAEEESWCEKNVGLPVDIIDHSLSGIYNSDISIDFMPRDDSLFQELGARKEEYIPEAQPPSDFLGAHCWDPVSAENCSKNLSFSYPERKSITSNCSDDEPRLSEVVEVLQMIPNTAEPNSVAKMFMEAHNELKKEKLSITEDCTPASSVKSDIPFETRYIEEHYKVKAVFGGIIHVDLVPFSTSQATWNIIGNMTKKAVTKFNIKQEVCEVTILPVTTNDFQLKVEEITTDKENIQCTKIHMLNIKVDLPVIEVKGLTDTNLNFGHIPEGGSAKKIILITLKNSGSLVLLPKFLKSSENQSVFNIENNFSCVSVIRLTPGESPMANSVSPKSSSENQSVFNIEDDFGCVSVMRLTPGDNPVAISVSPKSGFCEVNGDPNRVIECLALSFLPGLDYKSLEINMEATIFVPKLQMCIKNAETLFMKFESRTIRLFNNSSCEITAHVKGGGDFIPSCRSVMLAPSQIGVLQVRFCPESNLPPPIRNGEILISIVPGDIKYELKLSGKLESVTISEICPNDDPSDENMGPLLLECTDIAIAWSSRSLKDSPVRKTTWVRSKGEHREKLSIFINDSTSSFKLVKPNGETSLSNTITLKQMERKEICVLFSPTCLGQIRAEIIVQRVNSNNNTKRILLFGYGGCGRLHADKFCMDLVSKHFKIYISRDTLSGDLTLENTGDSKAFFMITQKKMEEIYLKVHPRIGVLEPGHKMVITLTLDLNQIGTKFLKDLLTTNNSIEIDISSLTVSSGDEATRLRIMRLYNKYKRAILQRPGLRSDMNSLSNLCNSLPGGKDSREMISKLKDPMTSAWNLFEEGISECTIQVVVQRHILEYAQLDKTQFTSILEQTKFDDTEYSLLNTTDCDNSQKYT